MENLNITQRINAKALELLENHPEGLHTTQLKKMIEAYDPTFHPKTVNGTVWKLTEKYPNQVYKPERGIFRLIKFKSEIDDYIASFPADIQEILNKMREVIQDAAPEATEAFAYGMPTFRLNGNLVHFAAFKDHIGFFPAPSGISAYKEDLAPYQTGKGTIRFDLDKPIPYDLVRKVVLSRVKENKTKG